MYYHNILAMTAAVLISTLTGITSSAVTVTAVLTDDNHVRESDPDSVQSHTGNLALGTGDNIFLKFDMGAVPLNAVINSATLTVRTRNDGASDVSVTVRGADDVSWTESSITWNNQPPINAVEDFYTAEGFVSSGNPAGTSQLDTPDVTAAVAAASLSGSGFVTIRLSTTGGNFIRGKEHPDQSEHPWASLEIDYSLSQLSQVAILTDDNHVRVSDPGNVQSHTGNLALGNGDRIFLKFGHGVPAGAKVCSATLRMRTRNDNNGDAVVNVSGVSDNSWDEATITWDNQPAAGSIENTYTAEGATSSGNPPGTSQVDDSDVTAVVRAASAAGDPDVSFRLDANGANFIRSKEHSVQSEHPWAKLIVDYVVPTVTVDAVLTDDNHVREGDPDNVQSHTGNLALGTGDNIFLKFDMGAVPPQTVIDSATLTMRTRNDFNGDGIVTVRGVSDNSWTESTITWNNAPTEGAVEDVFAVEGVASSGNPAGTSQLDDADVTLAVVAALAAGGLDVSIRLDATNSNFIRAKEHSVQSEHPWAKLTIVYSTCEVTDGVRPDQDNMVNVEQPDTVPDHTNNLSITNPNENYERRSFLRFDLSGIPDASAITAATLTMKTRLDNETVGNVNVAAVADDAWDETTITWNNQPAIGAVQGTYAVGPVAPGVADIDTVDLTSLVNSSFNNNDQQISVVLTAQGAHGMFFRADEHSLQTEHPWAFLDIQYIDCTAILNDVLGDFCDAATAVQPTSLNQLSNVISGLLDTAMSCEATSCDPCRATVEALILNQ
jgi:hypothetical protein